jgi:hypothetical protein
MPVRHCGGIVQLALKTRSGFTVEADVDLKAMLFRLKQATFARDEVPVGAQEFMLNVRQPEDDATFASCGTSDFCRRRLIVTRRNDEPLQLRA